MRKSFSLLVAPLLLGLACSNPDPSEKKEGASGELSELKAEARTKAKAFGGALKGELMSAMKAGGPTKAIELCNTRATPLAAEASDAGWTVARRSTRLRNPANAPDTWESSQLKSFEAQLAKQAAPESLEHAEILEVDGARTFRYAKAIVLGGECLGCHGSELSPEVVAELDARYPDDKARGYKAGELRGMFSLSKKL